jgi:hypothetical protein
LSLKVTGLSKTFTDKASGKDAKRLQLEAMQNFVREGDTLFCHSMDRLARNLDDLRRIVLGLTERGVHIVFVKENLPIPASVSPTNRSAKRARRIITCPFGESESTLTIFQMSQADRPRAITARIAPRGRSLRLRLTSCFF